MVSEQTGAGQTRGSNHGSLTSTELAPGVLKTLGGAGVVAPLLIDQSELILRLAIVRIERGRFQHAAEMLPVAHDRAQVRKLAGEKIPGEE